MWTIQWINTNLGVIYKYNIYCLNVKQVLFYLTIAINSRVYFYLYKI